MADTAQYCTFHLDRFYFGVTVMQVQEIIRYQEMTHVPLAPESVDGLINLRGQIVTAIDMRRRLEMPPRDSDRQPMNVIVHTHGDEAVSLLVDEIGDVLEVDEQMSEAPPETLEGVARELIEKAYKLEGRLLLILNADKAAQVNGYLGAEEAR